MVNKLRLEFSVATIAEAIHMENTRKELKRETKLNKLQEINSFKQPGENMVRYGPRYEMKSLSKPWDEVVWALMRYVTLDGCHKVVYAYHFGLLKHFRFGVNVNFPLLIHHSLKLSILK